MKKANRTHKSLDKYDISLYAQIKKKLRLILNIGENVLLLAERIKEKSARGEF